MTAGPDVTPTGLIAIDPTCTRDKEHMSRYLPADGERVIVVPELEERTGADMLISPSRYGFRHGVETSDAYIKMHLRDGACLLQWKFGLDLPSSIADRRIYKSLGKMHEIGAHPVQCWLLFVGYLSTDDAGYTTIDKLRVKDYVQEHLDQDAILTSIQAWQDMGGQYLNLPAKNLRTEVLNFCVRRMMRLQLYRTQPVRHLYPVVQRLMVPPYPDGNPLNPEPHHPLQQLVPAPASWQLIANLHGIGPKRVRAVMAYAGDAMSALEALTDYATLKSPNKPEGIGKGTIDNVRKQLGLTEGFVIRQIDPDDAEIVDGKLISLKVH